MTHSSFGSDGRCGLASRLVRDDVGVRDDVEVAHPRCGARAPLLRADLEPPPERPERPERFVARIAGTTGLEMVALSKAFRSARCHEQDNER